MLTIRRWYRHVRRELRLSRQERPRLTTIVVIAGLVSSTAIGLGIWSDQRSALARTIQAQSDADASLLELRAHLQRVQAIDWSHSDPLAQDGNGNGNGHDLKAVIRALEHSSTVRDGDSTWIVDRQGELLSQRGAPLEPSLQSCFQQRLQQLQQLSGHGLEHRAYSFLCRHRDAIVLGAGTDIRSQDDTGAAAGWLLQFSRLEQAGFTPEMRRSFVRIAQQLDEQPSPSSKRLPQISELQPPDQEFALRPLHSPAQVALQAVQRTAFPWLCLNGLLVTAGGATLLTRRHTRLQQRLRDRQSHQRLHHLRQELAGTLLSQSELLQRIDGAPTQFEGCWLACLQLKTPLFSSSFSRRSDAIRAAIHDLRHSIVSTTGTLLLARGEESSVLVVFQPIPAAQPGHGHTPLTWLEQHLEQLQQSLSASMSLKISGLLCPLDLDHVEQQLTDLGLLSQVPSFQDSLHSLSCAALRQEAGQLWGQLQEDFTLHHLAADLRGSHARLEPVLNLRGNRPQLAYSEMLFRLSEPQPRDMTIQKLVLSLERHGNIHLLDQHMLRKGIEQLSRPRKDCHKLGINLSAHTLQSAQHFEALMELLRHQPQGLRQQLVLEVTETALHEDLEMQTQRLDRLRALHVAIAIDDFGVGFASINYLFRFEPDFIKLDLSYGQRLHDPKVNALVAFLLRFCSDHRSELIVEGIETNEQLHYWRQRGVTLFQWYLFAAQPSAQRLLKPQGEYQKAQRRA